MSDNNVSESPANATSYPARLSGRLDRPLSRWLWLVKWLLVIPHVIVLVFLWIAVTVTTFIAGIAILFTAVYPRSLFTFALGVMRWTWRVAYYSGGAFGTDRYPPFTLADVPDYPARYTVDYPSRLSRPLVLIKWWLLAFPQLIIVGILVGGWGSSGGGLISILAIVAAVIVAFTGEYPQGLYDFIMGLNRWCYRVLAYVALMTDEYPPFRLDTGGEDPGPVTH